MNLSNMLLLQDVKYLKRNFRNMRVNKNLNLEIRSFDIKC